MYPPVGGSGPTQPVRMRGRASSVLPMDENQLTIIPGSHPPYADLDMLLNESDYAWATLATVEDDAERPDTVDSMNAQILAGLVSP
jgi:hypothetical protein